MQALITLDVENNRIDDIGVQYLANALRNNTVSLIVSSFVFYPSSSITDTQERVYLLWEQYFRNS
jgi:hypothetical protein